MSFSPLSVLSTVTQGRSNKPPRVLVYGPEGIGKSTFAASAPKPIFVQTEDGLDEIGTAKFPLARTFEKVMEQLVALRDEEHDFETVAVDSLDWLERLIWDFICRQFNVKNIEKADGGYARGYAHALGPWREFLDILDILRNKRRMVIILVAHAKVEKFESPESPTYDRYSPKLHKHACALVDEWCNAVLFATLRIRTQTEDGGFNKKRTIAHAVGKDGGERILKTTLSPTCVAKNRYSLPEEIPLSWAAFVEAMTANPPQS